MKKIIMLFAILWACAIHGYAAVFISDLMVSAEKSESTAKSNLTSQGYTVINQDLNQNAGGHYIFLGYKTTTDPRQAITGLMMTLNEEWIGTAGRTFTYGGSTYRSVAFNAESFGGNLNRGCGNKASDIYLYYTKDGNDKSTNAVLTSLSFVSVTQEQTTTINSYVTRYRGASSPLPNADFNLNAGGNYIYLQQTFHTHSLNWKSGGSQGCAKTCSCGFAEAQVAHSFEFVSSAATATQHKRHCKNCGYEDMVSHTLSYSYSAATCNVKCTVCGYNRTQAHVWGAKTYYSAQNHLQECANCKGKLYSQHTITWEPNAEGTGCGSVCHECEHQVASPTQHVWTTLQEAVAPTCQAEGKTARKQCTRCKYIQESTSVAKINHTTSKRTASSPSCLEPGYDQDHWQCTMCGKRFYDSVGVDPYERYGSVTPALGHNLEHIEEVPIHLCESGIVEHYHCKRCGKNYADEQATQQLTNTEIPYNGPHTYDSHGICTVNPTHYLQPQKNADGMYVIHCEGELAWLRNAVNAKTGNRWTDADGGAILTADLDLSLLECDKVKGWTPIGSSPNEGAGSWGATFDGQGHTISHLVPANRVYGGLFGSLSGQAVVRNLEIEGENVPDYNAYGSGLLCYQANGSTPQLRVKLENITVRGKVITSSAYVGGFARFMYRTDLTNCHNYATVSYSGLSTNTEHNSARLGGLAGQIYEATVVGCANFADITTETQVAGGLFGLINYHNVDFWDCANYGNIRGYRFTGGLVGNTDGQRTSFHRCLNMGNVVSAELTGDYVSAGPIHGSLETTANVTVDSCFTLSTALITGKTTTDNATLANDWADASGVKGYTAYVIQNTTQMIRVLTQGKGCSVWGQKVRTDSYPVPFRYGGHWFTSGADACQCGDAYPEPELDEDGYYVITKIGELQWFRDRVNAGHAHINGRLMADLNLLSVCSEKVGNWIPIGKSPETPFLGNFQGNRHRVTNLYINTPDADYVGLFGYCGTDDLEVVDSRYIQNLEVFGTVVGHNHVGTLAGLLSGFSVYNCQSGGTVTSSGKYCGGLIGTAYLLQNISRCTNYAIINGTSVVGGIVGQAYLPDFVGGRYGTRVAMCINEVAVNATGTEVGGIIGEKACSGEVTLCANRGNISTSSRYVAGIVGYCGKADFAITLCYNSTEVHSTDVNAPRGSIAPIACNATYRIELCYYLERDVYYYPEQNVQKNLLGTVVGGDDFTSGRVAYELGQYTDMWGQKLPGETLPQLGSPKVVTDGEGHYTNADIYDRNEDGKISIVDAVLQIDAPLDYNQDKKWDKDDLQFIIDRILERTTTDQ